ncbi:MAG: 30S ribosomal protein S3 [Pseudomonadota bacterium]|nr:30S ribosomal protein S3 [Pseudomonadota bacterium]
MGQKVHPTGIRLGITKSHNSVWYASPKEYSELLLNDLEVREFLQEKLKRASVSRIVIERPAENAKITIHTARPGIVIGKKGEDIEKLRKEVSQKMGVPVQINIQEIKKPDLDAKLVAENIAQQLERRVMFRRAMKRAVQNAMKAGAEGIKVQVSGRLGGAEIARSEWYREGRVSLHTFRADIDYSTARAETLYGTIGVKVWIYKGEVILGAQEPQQEVADKPAKKRKSRKEG